VIDEAGGNLGVMPREAALKLAEEKGLDLIEIAPTAKPPVVKVISFDKFRYQKEKELKKQKAGQKMSELKQIRISARAAQNDLEIKAKKVEEFLEDGDKVEINLFLRGREKYNRNWARQKLDEFLKIIPVEYKVIADAKFGGRGLTIQIVKK
jgi:translation initiation factor IF-3